ncbi:hypothetical protein Tco_0475183 [Tanacetum coccineum]
MHCHKCWEAGHNKKSCKNPAKPKPPNFYQPTPAPEQASNTNETPEHFAEQMPVYKIDPVLPKQKAPTEVWVHPYLVKSGQREGLQEHAFMMDQEALAETLRAEEAEQAAIREIWRQNEENDKAWELMQMILRTSKEHFTPADVEPSTPAKKKRGRPKKATTEPSLKPSTKAAAKKSKGKELASVEASTTADAKKTRVRAKKHLTTYHPMENILKK